MLSSGIVKWRDVLALTQGFSISVGLYILDLQRDVRLPRSNTKTCHRGERYTGGDCTRLSSWDPNSLGFDKELGKLARKGILK
jgi:hypothetical protein